MRLLCYANVGSIIANALIAAGHDIVRTIRDDAVSDGRVLVTAIATSRELVFKHGTAASPGIIHIRFEPDDVAEIAPRLLEVLDFSALKSHMTVIGDTTIRRTLFPAKSANDA